MPKQTIPDNIKKQVDEIVARFNHQVIKNPNYFYFTRYRGEMVDIICPKSESDDGR